MINTIAGKVSELRAARLSPAQIARILTQRGTSITRDEVEFILTWDRFRARMEAARRREALKRDAMARRRERQSRLEKERQRRAEQRLAALNMSLEALRRYERYGCVVDRRGRVRLPKMEAAE